MSKILIYMVSQKWEQKYRNMQTNIKRLIFVIFVVLSSCFVFWGCKTTNSGLDLKTIEDEIKKSIKTQSAYHLTEEQLQERVARIMNYTLEFRLIHEKSDERSQKLLDDLYEKDDSSIKGFRVVEVEGKKYFERQKDFTEDLSADTLAGYSKDNDYVFMMQRADKQRGNALGAADLFVPCLVERLPKLTDSDVAYATTGITSVTMLTKEGTIVERIKVQEVILNFNPDGTKKISELTTHNINKPLAIILNGHVYFDPIIRTPITDGAIAISAGFTAEQAKQLSLIFTACAIQRQKQQR